ncbi:unnamed protein product [Prorocentrum cordatum]|uniref:Uncharacterized protein n=1 Tax=Prorocentrum cordatum TaxID=2364126 RepID=A0ABN9SJD0_9DINO|nr:unnamed protein product [Polarella glacialis]
MGRELQAAAFSSLLEGIKAAGLRRKLVEHLMRHAVAEAAAAIFQGSEQTDPLECEPCQVLNKFEGTLRRAGSCMGLDQAATTEQVRKKLVDNGLKHLVKEWFSYRAGRRACAHPPGDMQQRVLAALNSDSMCSEIKHGMPTETQANAKKKHLVRAGLR